MNNDVEKKLPIHICILLDGNRRWAKDRGLSTNDGHEAGGQTMKKITKYANQKGIKFLTLFIFSTENWNRSEDEVNFMMDLGKRALYGDLKELGQDGIKIKVIGDAERVPKEIRDGIKNIELLTKDNNGLQLNLAISYGGRWDIIQAVKKIIDKKIPAEEITEETMKENLSTGLIPDPDLVIRTSGVQRISNFLIWQSAYSELLFIEKYWPDFSEKDFDEVLEEYSRRQRRFGK